MLVLLKQKGGEIISSTEISQPSLCVLSLTVFPSVELSSVLQNISSSALMVVKFAFGFFPASCYRTCLQRIELMGLGVIVLPLLYFCVWFLQVT